MSYYLDLFSPQTHKAFSDSNRDVSGFRLRQLNAAKKIKIGDKLICYITNISRWTGILEVTSSYFEDLTPIFYGKDDPFIVRFKVKPIVWLSYEESIPIHEDKIWKSLSYTKELDENYPHWTGFLRNSLRKMNDADGKLLENLLINQSQKRRLYPLSENDKRKVQPMKMRTHDSSEVIVNVPEDTEINDSQVNEDTLLNESKRIQALIAKIGESMGYKIWIPKNDRSRVIVYWNPKENVLLDNLPMNYDEVTIKTIEQIDVIWIDRSSIVRAFEVEHTTAIYSGILRMADLMALQPNINIRSHIVAPQERRDKVFSEITRPVFNTLEKGALYKSCTFLSYDAIEEIANQKTLKHLRESVINDYDEQISE
ncbi:MAG: hypothetical protein WC877_09105 [Dehalococcoidales bacterium]|jgi:predicted RNA-binding protein